MRYPERERKDIYEFFVRHNYNKKRAQREYRRVYGGERSIPAVNTFKRIYDQVEATTSFKVRGRREVPRGEDQANEDLNFLLYFQGM